MSSWSRTQVRLSFLKEFPRITFFHLLHPRRYPGIHQVTTPIARFRPEIDDPVG